MQVDLSFISCRNVIRPPSEVDAIIDKQDRKKKNYGFRNISNSCVALNIYSCFW